MDGWTSLGAPQLLEGKDELMRDLDALPRLVPYLWDVLHVIGDLRRSFDRVADRASFINSYCCPTVRLVA
jgi:hypothetical protein